MGKGTRLFRYISKSAFLKSVFLRVLSIFVIVSIGIAGIAFYSFTEEIQRNSLAERKRQLSAAEETISARMEEISSIAYNIGTDPAFYLEPVEGTGLGMAIAKNLVELMGGAISCESELGRGTTFTVTMNMELASPDGQGGERPAAETQEAPALDGRRILLVEDNAINREIARTMIGETGADVIEAADGQAAVEMFAARPEGYFDMILMDLQMPVMNGYEATAAIRASERLYGKSVPIYALTADTFDEDVRRVREAGMNGHIGKPYTLQALYGALAEALGGNGGTL